MVESFVSDLTNVLWRDPYRFAESFDGTNVAPPLFCAFVITTMLFGGRFGSMGLFPYQPTIDYAFKYSVISDVVLWILISTSSDTWATSLLCLHLRAPSIWLQSSSRSKYYLR